MVAGLLGGCASVAPPEAPALPAPASAEQRTALAAALATERRWLDSWFHGTPVRVVQRDDGALQVEVPREFCFDAGRSSVKPALAAVLDKLAESLQRRPAARVLLLAAPGDAVASTPLALQRAAQLQRHLRERGVPAARLAEPTLARAAAVQLRIGAPAP